LFAVLCTLSGLSAEKPSRVTWEGQKIEDITDVHVNPDGKIIVIHSAGGFSTTEDKLPVEFLKAWGISDDQLQAAKGARAQTLKDDFEKALRAGQFREVKGIVYDLRKLQADWNFFPKAKVLQVIDGGAILDCTPDQSQRPTPVFVRNLPKALADTDFISFTAKLTGSYSYISKLGYDRTIREYDLGRPCSRDEIPEAITKDKKLWAKALFESKATQDVLSQLPDNEQLKGNGTGFFVTTNGYLLSNWHVVRNANRVKVRTHDQVLPAEIVRTDRAADLALLKVSGGPFKSLPLSLEDVSLGESTFTIGFPNFLVQGLEPKYTDGKISSLSGVRDDPSQYQISVPVQPGNSGGPLVGRNGQVIGVVDAKLDDISVLAASGSLPQNVNYAIKAKVVREFLLKCPEVQVPVSNAALKSEEAVKCARDAVVMVLIY